MKTFKQTSLMSALLLSLGASGTALATDNETPDAGGYENRGRFGLGKTAEPRQQGESIVPTGEGNYGSGVDSDTQRNPEPRHGGGEKQVHSGADKDNPQGGVQKDDEADLGDKTESARPEMKVDTVESNTGSATSPGGASAPVQL